MKSLILFAICLKTLALDLNCPCKPRSITQKDFCDVNFVTHAVVKTVNQLNDRFLNYTVEHKRIYKVSSLLQLLPKSNPSNNNNLPTTIIALGEGNPCGVKLELKKHYLLGDSLRILNSDAEQFQPKYTEKRTRTQTQQYTENWKHLRQMLAVE
ncbi:hypothetical protein Y032_0009g561 [Ancylostoma ceylanicum]|uniref:NTR domain-containing protein n=1 Tax=Ancylostoma ceylanicum TaxID=53326 RepID=A0A016VID6_9BILA|nr:hypothetical protein Y032_0009g561 [Ancylostoma ceylanicum]